MTDADDIYRAALDAARLAAPRSTPIGVLKRVVTAIERAGLLASPTPDQTETGDLLSRALRDRDEAMNQRDEIVEDAYEDALGRGATWAIEIHAARRPSPRRPA